MNSRRDRSPKNLETNKEVGNEWISMEGPPLHLDTTTRGSSSYKQEDAVVVNKLLRMFPMWGMIFAVSLISATGFTFFLKQYDELDNMNKFIPIPIQIYTIVQEFSRFSIPFLYGWICGLHNNEKVKIGVGMLYGIISCIFAWLLEIHRLEEVTDDLDSDVTSISCLWLVPQFCVLGCMEGLTRDGLLKFYRYQMKEGPQLISYGEEYIEIVMGLGKLINIVLILVFDSQWGWFGKTINDSRVDKYYLVLVYVCSANFIVYCFIARYFYKGQDVVNDDQEKDNQVLASDDQKQGKNVFANDDKKQCNQVLVTIDEKQDLKDLASDDWKQDNQVLSNQKQGDQVLTSDNPKQGLHGVLEKFGRNHRSRRRLRS